MHRNNEYFHTLRPNGYRKEIYPKGDGNREEIYPKGDGKIDGEDKKYPQGNSKSPSGYAVWCVNPALRSFGCCLG